jgi:hypothetical protein
MKIVAALTVLALTCISVGDAGDPLSPAARGLLKRPRLGPAILTLRDRTTVQGDIAHVTSQYVVLQQCQNIDIAKIARIKYLRPSGDYVNPAETAALYTLLTPFLLGSAIRNTLPDRKLFGFWQSLVPPTGGAGMWVEFREPNFVDSNLIHIRRGTYRLDGEVLKLTYNDNLAGETISISFNCNQIILGLPVPLTLRWYDNPLRVASAPIVGRWLGGLGTGYWQFKPDGTFETKTTENTRHGTFTKESNGKLKIDWNMPSGIPEEEWSAEFSHSRLFLTTKGTSAEYERRDSRL